MPESKLIELFGGAITAEYPATFEDVSNIRQVPDNQEVYLDNSGFSSIVVELLERVDKPDNEALEYHLRDLVEDDEDDAAQKTKVWWSGDAVGAKLPPNTPTYNLLATSPPGAKQQGRVNEPEFVAIMLTLIRLVEWETDVLVTVNVPHVKGEFEVGSMDLEKGRMGALLERAAGWRERVLETLEVKDWGLFGEE